MSTPANSINEATTGIVGMNGTGFTATPVTQYLVQIGGATSSTLAEVPIGSATQVLTSNGAGLAPTFQAAGGGGLVTITGQLTSAQIKALHGTPIQILPAQGAGTVIVPTSVSASFVYGGSNVFVAGAAQTIDLYMGTVTQRLTAVSNAALVGTTGTITYVTVNALSQATAGYNNLPLNWYNPIVTEISGNAANNNVINWSVTYRVVTV